MASPSGGAAPGCQHPGDEPATEAVAVGRAPARVLEPRKPAAEERRQLIRLRDNGAIGDAVMRRIQRDLDYEELMLHHE